MRQELSVLLRVALDQDMVCIADLRSDCEMQHRLMAHPAPRRANNPLEETRAWVARRDAAGYFRVVASADNAAMGFVQIFEIHRKNRVGWIGIALARRVHGQGIGAAALVAVENIAVVDLGLRKLLLQVRADNERAISLYEKAGWRRAGCLHAQYDDGMALFDVLIYEKLLSPS